MLKRFIIQYAIFFKKNLKDTAFDNKFSELKKFITVHKLKT